MNHITSAYNISIGIAFLLSSAILFWSFMKYEKASLNIALILSLCLLPLIRIELIVLLPLFFIWWIIIKKEKLKLTHNNIKYWIKNILIWMLIISVFFYSHIQIFNIDMLDHTGEGIHSFKLSNIPNTFTNHLIPLLESNLFGSFIILIFIICLIISVRLLFNEKRLIGGIFLISITFSIVTIHLMNSYYDSYLLASILPSIVFLYAIPIVKLIHVRNSIIRCITLILLFFLIIAITGYSLIEVNTNSQYEELYLVTPSPAIIENYVPEGCLVISSYKFTLTTATSPIVEGLEKMREKGLNFNNFSILLNRSILNNSCAYFFEDYYCHADYTLLGIPLKPYCNILKENYILKPELIIKSSRAPHLNSTLYKISILDHAVLNKTIEVKKIIINYTADKIFGFS